MNPEHSRFDSGALGATPPAALVDARILAHHAVQWPTRAARANLPASPDDSHSSLAWDAGLGALLSQPLPTRAGELRIGVRLAGLRLIAVRAGRLDREFILDGNTDAAAGAWVDAVLDSAGLAPASSVRLPYAIPAHPVATGTPYEAPTQAQALAELARWYHAAGALLSEFGTRIGALRPGPGPVRCWPHHFDIAILVRLEAVDPEHARSIGVGLSPGDDFYPQPYVYLSPWPAVPPEGLPALPPPGHWHTQGFTGAVATGEAILALADRHRDLLAFLTGAFEILRARLGA
jgi:hypothetical protein